MSDQAHVDHQKLIELCQDLRSFSGAISDLVEDLDRGLVRLGSTFEDDSYREFSDAYRGARVRILEFLDTTRAYWPVLEQDAEDLAASKRERLE